MKSNIGKTLLIISAAFLSGCITPTERPVSAAFVPEQLVPFQRVGSATIAGQAFLKTRGGDVKIAAGETVSLTPAIPFIKEVRALRDSGVAPVYTEAVSEQIRPSVRKAIVDAQGNFQFENLPPGEYLLEVLIKWDTGRGLTGGLVTQYVVVEDGRHHRVILTR